PYALAVFSDGRRVPGEAPPDPSRWLPSACFIITTHAVTATPPVSIGAAAWPGGTSPRTSSGSPAGAGRTARSVRPRGDSPAWWTRSRSKPAGGDGIHRRRDERAGSRRPGVAAGRGHRRLARARI